MTGASPANGVVVLSGIHLGGSPGWVLSGRQLLPVVSWSDSQVAVQLPTGPAPRAAYLRVIRSDGRFSNAVFVRLGD